MQQGRPNVKLGHDRVTTDNIYHANMLGVPGPLRPERLIAGRAVEREHGDGNQEKSGCSV
jgi:hypothetical protein